AGATGMVGGEAARILSSGGNAVRALVRSTSGGEKVAPLKSAGIEVVEGDLRDRPSLDAACEGVDAVITTVSAMPFSWQEGNTFGEVDRDGTIRLIDAAAAAGARRFVYTSFPHSPEPGFALGDAKAAAEDHLRSSGIEYAILAANFFMEVWLSPALGFDYPNHSATVYGDGTNRMSWVSYKDVARTAAEAVSNPKAKNAVLPVGGPSIHTPLEVVTIFEKASAKTWTLSHVSVAALQEQKSAATDEVQEAVAMLQLGYAIAPGWAMDPTDYLVASDLRSVEQYAREVTQ
ncbi:MAG: SDR family oxidoreductase, partial [Gemmatimonadota bacterium]|nr:SDR family oxidoreductase [Gemmatimonadota bacterium]